jgi:hypothetical protein
VEEEGAHGGQSLILLLLPSFAHSLTSPRSRMEGALGDEDWGGDTDDYENDILHQQADREMMAWRCLEGNTLLSFCCFFTFQGRHGYQDGISYLSDY